jgi:MoxR-like ATPase
MQFTPDVLPSDVTGFSMYNKKINDFEYKKGAVICNLFLADEINRTSSKTQSALLEAMEEKQVTVDGVTRELPKPFMVIATENPLGFVGTYPLPEAQLDRFLVKFTIGYPDNDSEVQIISDRKNSNPIEKVSAVASVADVLQMQQAVSEMYVDKAICKYIVDLVQATRNNKNIVLAASPRASIALLKASSANALISGRNYVTPQDVIDMFPYVVGHRIVLSAEAKLDRLTNDVVLDEIKNSIKAPVLRK